MEGRAVTRPICEILDTEYGPMIVPIYDINQTGALRATRRGVHHDRMMMLCGLLDGMSPDRVVVDAGANIGAFTLGLANHLGDGGLLHAFEPQPILCNMLAGTVALSQRTNVRVHNVCLGAGTAVVEVPQFDYAWPLNFGSIEFGTEDQHEVLSQQRQHDAARREYVPVLPLDDYRLERLDLMKIDVQSMEIEVLKGARETLARCRPILFVEWIGNQVTELEGTLDRLGYRITATFTDDWLCRPV